MLRQFSTQLGRLGKQTVICQSCRSISGTEQSEPLDLYPSLRAKHRIVQPVDGSQFYDGAENQPKPPRTPKKPFNDKFNRNMVERSSRRKGDRKSGRMQSMHKKPLKLKGELLYGKFPVLIALKAQRRVIHKLFVKSKLLETGGSTSGISDQLIAFCKQQDIDVEFMSQHQLNDMVFDPEQGQRQHQGVCADVSPLPYEELDQSYCLSENTSTRPQIWIVLQSVQDPNNFGAILRSAYYLGVDRIIGYNSCKLSSAVSKVSAGALELMDINQIHDISEFLKTCRSADWQILGTGGMRSQQTSSEPRPDSPPVQPLDDISIHKNTVIVLGNEGSGLDTTIGDLCDKLVVVPRNVHRGQRSHLLLDSLNVSVATGIILHDLLNKRDRIPMMKEHNTCD